MANQQLRIPIFVLLSLASLSQLAFASGSIFTCEQAQFDSTMQLCGIAAVAMFALIALAYIGGEAFQSPRMLMWSKAEAIQAFASLVIVSVILFSLSSMCSFQVGELKTVLGLPAMPKIYADAGGGADTLYNASSRYIENLAAISLSNINSLRYDLGAYERRISYNTFECAGDCLFSLASVSIAPFGGESMKLAITNNLLGIATVSYLSSIFQYFTLVYIYGGIFMLFLPLAIVLRSVPFMRHFGGSLIAIFVSLYLIYPIMLVADAYIAPGFTASIGSGEVAMCPRDANTYCKGSAIFSTVPPVSATAGITCKWRGQDDTCKGKLESELDEAGYSEAKMNGLFPSQIPNAIKLNVLIFLSAVFLPAINFIVIVAFGRELSRFLGEEADMSRLGQMI